MVQQNKNTPDFSHETQKNSLSFIRQNYIELLGLANEIYNYCKLRGKKYTSIQRGMC